MNTSPNSRPKVLVKIHSLSFSDGHGVGRDDDGKVYFVDQACPNDIVEVEVYKENKRYSFAKIKNILYSSELRVQPQCPAFESCGGCTIQHVNYENQIIEKQKVLERYHTKNSFFKLEKFESCNNIYNYRNRIEVHIKNNKWGFYKKRSNQLVFIDKCHVASEDIQNHLQKPLNLIDGHYHIDQSGIKARTRGLEGVFEQINPEIDLKIKNQLLKIIQKNYNSVAKIYDLYAGHGNYSRFLTEYLKTTKFVTVELSQTLVNKGKSLESKNSNIEWICSDVIKFISKLDQENFHNSLVLVNPPRDGMDSKFLNQLLIQSPRFLIYVSCNPMTLFRDIDALSPKYKLHSLKGFDMFPQTMHFETIAFLTPT